MSRYNSNFNSHVSADKKKWALVTISIVLLVVLITGIITEGFREWNPWCWFGHTYEEGAIACAKCGKEKPVEVKPDEQPAEGAVVGDSEGNMMALASRKIARPNYASEGISPLAESAYQLTATITPADASEKAVKWSIAWKNASSTWASGKTVTDYVTVTPTSDGALTANVECLQAFGEQVIVTVESLYETAVEATVTVDYYKRAIGFNLDLSIPGFTFDSAHSDGQFSSTNENVVYGCSFATAYTSVYEQAVSIKNLVPVFGVGTLDGNYSCSELFIADSAVGEDISYNIDSLPTTRQLIEDITGGVDISTVSGRAFMYYEYGDGNESFNFFIKMTDSNTNHSYVIQLVITMDYYAPAFYNPVTNISLNPGSLKF